MPFTRWFRLCTGRRITVRPYNTTMRGGLVRVRFQNAEGDPLPSMADSLTADEAEALGSALIAAAAVARHEHATSAPKGRTA